MNLPDTLHCANISIISTASCDKDYPGRLMDTMVCAGVEGGGTDSCEVRARGRRGRKTGLGIGTGSGFACLGPEEMLGVAMWAEKAEQLEQGRGWRYGGGKVGSRSGWAMWWLVWDRMGWSREGEWVRSDFRWEMCQG